MNIHQIINRLSKAQKRAITLLADISFISISFWVGLYLYPNSEVVEFSSEIWTLFFVLLLFSLFIFIRVGLYRAVLSYIDTKALAVVTGSILTSTAFLILLAFYLDLNLPRSLPYIYATHLALMVGGSRIFFRAMGNSKKPYERERVVIYGAGSAGTQLATALHNCDEYYVEAFVDDDRKKCGSKVMGSKVYEHSQLVELIERINPSKLLLAIPSITPARRKNILLELEHLPVKVQSIPSINDLVKGKHKIDDIHDVDVHDLLGRAPVEPNTTLLRSNIDGKVVMVTGAGGSIGSELCRQIVLLQPRKLILFELSEYALYSIEKELSAIKLENELDVEILPLLGSVQRKNRLKAVIQSFSVQTLYHAAAYKHVPLVEYNVVEGVRNNIFGTLAVAEAAINAKVETFVLISTDKAVRPTNVMGATKRMAELVLQALAMETHNTRFCMVRFGNVLGSSGSVVPLFRKQIAKGGPVTITHPEITRYFMTIPEASQLVIQAGAMGKGGDVFVLDMGQPVRIHDLAIKMIHLSGLKVSDENGNGDIEVQYTGLRPGEKLYEELLVGDNVSGTQHERIMTANEYCLSWSKLKVVIDELDSACHHFEHERIRELLLNAPTSFNPSSEIEDLVWKHSTYLKPVS